jgi:hypothetical protein
MEHTMNFNLGLLHTGAPLMPEIVADPPSPSCYLLFPGPRIQQSQGLAPDLYFASRATRAGGGSEQAGAGKSDGLDKSDG